MKVIVLGAAGMLGHKMFQVLRRQYPETVGTILGTRATVPAKGVEFLQGHDVIERLDASDRAALEDLLRTRRPDVVVNCIGLVKQRDEADSPLANITCNALLPHVLVDIVSSWTTPPRIIHFSTDCVFDGRRGAYTEADVPNADDLYGRSKALGEIGRCGQSRGLTLRTSIIGRELANFRSLLEWFLAQRSGAVRGYTRAIYAGVTTNHLAHLVGEIVEKHPQLTGLYQVASEPISKYDLLRLIRDAYRCDVDINPDESFVCDRSMRGDKLFSAIGYRPPPWPELVRELAADATPYERWRA